MLELFLAVKTFPSPPLSDTMVFNVLALLNFFWLFLCDGLMFLNYDIPRG